MAVNLTRDKELSPDKLSNTPPPQNRAETNLQTLRPPCLATVSTAVSLATKSQKRRTVVTGLSKLFFFFFFTFKWCLLTCFLGLLWPSVQVGGAALCPWLVKDFAKRFDTRGTLDLAVSVQHVSIRPLNFKPFWPLSMERGGWQYLNSRRTA